MAQIIPSVADHNLPQFIQLHPREYTNRTAISNVIHYITRTRPNEDRKNELLSYGTATGWPNVKSPEEIIDEFEYIAKSYHTKGSRLVHYSIQISESVMDKIGSISQLNACLVECCKYIFRSCGFQSCYAVHYSEEKKLHAHLVINSTSYYNGNHIKQFPLCLRKQIEEPLLQIFGFFMEFKPKIIVYPVLSFSSLYRSFGSYI